jgi:segregation and condensation protein A
VAPPVVKIEARLDLSGVSAYDLMLAARSVLLAQPDLPALSRVVAKPRITIREKIGAIISAIRRIGQTTFRALLLVKNDRLEMIVTFLAMLELIKRHAVSADQPDLFGDIQIQPAEDLDENEALAEVEFIE